MKIDHRMYYFLSDKGKTARSRKRGGGSLNGTGCRLPPLDPGEKAKEGAILFACALCFTASNHFNILLFYTNYFCLSNVSVFLNFSKFVWSDTPNFYNTKIDSHPGKCYNVILRKLF